MSMGMASGFLRDYRNLMENDSDPRVKEWFMMSGPLPTISLILFYIYFVKFAGPKLMEHRKAFDLKIFLFCYNIFQIAFNSWLFYEALIRSSMFASRCAPVDKSDDPEAVRVAELCWWYFICKLTELSDTVTFVLRKKNEHVSGLHVLHHSIMPLSVWFGVKFVPGGHGTFFGFLNTAVHIVMYTYYFLSSLGPSVQKYLYWKRHVTTLQLFHFIVIALHALQVLLADNCSYPKLFTWWTMLQALMFYVLFNEFYKQTYGKSAPFHSVFLKKRGIKQN